MFVYADQRVGETKETYRARTKTCPFNIPLVRYGRKSGTVASIQVMTSERVQGMLLHGELYVAYDRAFDVKHDGEKFSVGSGSGKHTFYFKNWDAK